MIKAGAKKFPGMKNCPKYGYRDIHFDGDKWADAKKYIPEDYDLVLMRVNTGEVIPGWACGYKFEGLRLKPEHVVKYWKRKLD